MIKFRRLRKTGRLTKRICSLDPGSPRDLAKLDKYLERAIKQAQKLNDEVTRFADESAEKLRDTLERSAKDCSELDRSIESYIDGLNELCK